MSLARLTELTALARAHGSEELADWLGAAVDVYLTTSDSDLLALLGLKGPGLRHPCTLHRKRLRDDHLRRAAYLLCPEGTDGDRVSALDREIQVFRRIWPRWERLEAPPERADDVQRELFSVFRTGLVVPQAGQLRAIVRGVSPDTVTV